MNFGNLMTASVSSVAQVAIALFFGPQITAAAAGVVGVAEYLKHIWPKVPSTLTVLLLATIAGASLAEFKPAGIIGQVMPVLGAAWLGYAGIVTRFKKEESDLGKPSEESQTIQPKSAGGL